MYSVLGRAMEGFSTRIKDAGIAIRHLRERILFYTAGLRNEFGRCGYTLEKEAKLSSRDQVGY